MYLNKYNLIKRSIIVILSLCLFAFLYIFNMYKPVEIFNRDGNSFEKALVTEIVEDNIQEDGSRIGDQKIKVKILSGSLKGEFIDATSSSGFLYGADCKVNMKVILNLSTSSSGNIATVYNYYRSPIIYIFILIFLSLLWLIGGKNGFKSAVSLVFTFTLIIYLFIYSYDI